MTPIKILFIATEYAPGMIPFASTIINTLVKNEQFKIYCLCVNSEKQSYYEKISNKAHCYHINYPQNKIVKLIYKIWPLKIIRTIKTIKKEINPDIIHYLTGEFTLTLYTKLVVDNSYYYTVHDLYSHEVKNSGFFNKLMHSYITWGYKQCRDLINNLTTSSIEQYQTLKSLYPNKNITYTLFPSLITNTILVGNAYPEELNDVSNYILFFGAVNLYKGVDLLIDAFNTIENTQNIKLVIAGKGLDYICNNPNIIRINRYIDDNEIKSLFKYAKFVVYPYRTATMSGVFSLAFYFNKKVLASDISYFKEYTCSNIVYFRNNNVVDLKNKIKILIQHNEWDYKDNSYDFFYGEEKLIEDYKRLYFNKTFL